MRILVALIAVFMVSSAVAQKKPVGLMPVGIGATCTITCNVGYSPAPTCIGMCKDPKTGKVVNIECKVPPAMAQKMPKKMSGAELRELCPNWNQGDWNGAV